MTLGKELIQSANEALAIAEGRAEPAAVFVPESIDVAAIRKRLKGSDTGGGRIDPEIRARLDVPGRDRGQDASGR